MCQRNSKWCSHKKQQSYLRVIFVERTFRFRTVASKPATGWKSCQKREDTFIGKNTDANGKGGCGSLHHGSAGSSAMTWAESQKGNIDFSVVNLVELNLAVIR